MTQSTANSYTKIFLNLSFMNKLMKTKRLEFSENNTEGFLQSDNVDQFSRYYFLIKMFFMEDQTKWKRSYFLITNCLNGTNR